jgi:hypothetical protein
MKGQTGQRRIMKRRRGSNRKIETMDIVGFGFWIPIIA